MKIDLKKRIGGFSLIEAVIVISIVGILMALGAPSYKYVTTSNRLSSEANGLLGDMEFARSEAIKEGQPVTICTSTNGTTCLGGGGDTAWASGWIVFSDANGDATVNGTDAVLRIQKPWSNADTFNADNNINAVTFNREGFATNLPNANVTLTLHDATANSGYTRCLSITTVGQMAVQTHNSLPACT